MDIEIPPKHMYGLCFITLNAIKDLMGGYAKKEPAAVESVKLMTAESCPPEHLERFCSFIVEYKEGDGSVSIHRKQLYTVLILGSKLLEKLIDDCERGSPSAIAFANACEHMFNVRETLESGKRLAAILPTVEDWVKISGMERSE